MADGQLWPFAAARQVSEVLEWLTDILPAEQAEQRIALRPLPRETITLRHRLDALGMAEAAGLARGGYAGAWQVPLWHMAVRPSAALAQGSDEIAVDTTVTDFRAGDLVAIIVDAGRMATAEISAVSDEGLVLTTVLDSELPASSVAAHRVLLCPVREAILAGAVSVDRERTNLGTVEARFLLRDGQAPAALSLTEYQNRPVLETPSIVRRSLSSSLRRAVEFVDNGFGPVVVETVRDWFERGETVTRKAVGPAARWELRRWLYGLRGRQASFWLPTWGRDLQLRLSVSSGATMIYVAPVGPLESYIGRSILVETTAGFRFRSITDAVESGSDHRLTLSSSLGVSAALGTAIHFMSPVRSDADRFEIQHGAVASEVTIPFVEVPE